MQIDYNQYMIELHREIKEAKTKFEASTRRPCMAERYGRYEGLCAAMDFVTVMIKDTLRVERFVHWLSARMFIACDGRINPWNQRYEFGRVMGFNDAYKLLREHMARTIHIKEVP